jgi:hypothetical protein
MASSPSLQEMTRNPFVLRLFVEALPSVQAAALSMARITRYDVYTGFVRQWFGREVGRLSVEQRVALGLGAGDDMGDVGPVVAAFELLCALLAGEMLKTNVLTVSFATVVPITAVAGGGTGVGGATTERAVWQRVQVTADAWASGGEAALVTQFATLSPPVRRGQCGVRQACAWRPPCLP